MAAKAETMEMAGVGVPWQRRVGRQPPEEDGC